MTGGSGGRTGWNGGSGGSGGSAPAGDRVSEAEAGTSLPVPPIPPLPPLPRSPATFAALRHRNFRLFFFGQSASLIGTWVQQVALAWLVLLRTDSAFYVGLVSALGSLPVLFLALYAGVIVDRVSKLRMVIVTQGSAMVLAAALAGLYFTGSLGVAAIMVLAALLGIATAFDIPARQALLVELVGKEDLLGAIALNSTSFNATRIIGPAVAGVVIAGFGVGACFALNAVSFVAFLAALLAVRLPPFQRPIAHVSTWSQLREGLVYVLRDRRMRTLVALIAVLSVFGFQFLTLLPVVAKNVLGRGAAAYGWMMSAVGVGALAGALGIATFARRIPRGAVLSAAAAAFGVIIIAFALSRALPLSLALLVAAGLAMILNSAMTNALLQTLAPDALRGRIVSVYTLAFIGLAPLGALQAGSLAERFGAPAAIGAGGVLCAIVVGIAVWRTPELRKAK